MLDTILEALHDNRMESFNNGYEPRELTIVMNYDCKMSVQASAGYLYEQKGINEEHTVGGYPWRLDVDQKEPFVFEYQQGE